MKVIMNQIGLWPDSIGADVQQLKEMGIHDECTCQCIWETMAVCLVNIA